MASVKSGQLTATKEWARHLRPFGRRQFWKGERRAGRKAALPCALRLGSVRTATGGGLTLRLPCGDGGRGRRDLDNGGKQDVTVSGSIAIVADRRPPLPWTGPQFAAKHNQKLKGKLAAKAAKQAGAMIRSGVPEGIAIATANKHAKATRRKRSPK